MTFDDFMRKLPMADDSWHCKWFWIIVLWGTCCFFSGLLTGSVIGYVLAAICLIVLLKVFKMRRRGLRCVT